MLETRTAQLFKCEVAFESFGERGPVSITAGGSLSIGQGVIYSLISFFPPSDNLFHLSQTAGHCQLTLRDYVSLNGSLNARDRTKATQQLKKLRMYYNQFLKGFFFIGSPIFVNPSSNWGVLSKIIFCFWWKWEKVMK